MLYHKHIVKSSGEKEELQSKTEAREALRKDRKRIQVGEDTLCKLPQPAAPHRLMQGLSGVQMLPAAS